MASFTGSRSGIDIGVKGAWAHMIPTPSLMVKEFETLGVNVQSFRKPLEKAIKDVVIPSIDKNFNVGGRPPWKPLSLDTIFMRAQQIASATGQPFNMWTFNPGDIEVKPLQRSGKMRKTVTQFNMWVIDRKEAYISPDMLKPLDADVNYPILQNEGFTGGYGAVTPARPFLVIQEEDANEIEEIFFIWIEERFAAMEYRKSMRAGAL